MKNNKYKILVLSDLKEKTNSTLKNAISLSKMIGANIEFFHVKKPIDIVETDSQLSAIRTINKEYIVIKKKIQNLIEPISKDYNVNISRSFAFGNLKSEIENYIKVSQPDVIVLGKRNHKPLSFIRENITDFVLNVHKGAVLIVSDTYGLEPNEEFILGFFNNEKQLLSLNFTNELIGHTNLPLKSFRIVDKTNCNKEKLISTTNKTVDYVFEKSDSAFNTLSSYLIKNKVNLLCINRESNIEKQSIIKSEINNIINKVSVSLFLTNERHIITN
ncbi:hypothetical protein A9Q86_06565 [Flavobacteriales bacterium 33_180_T64]|nr:hypothetical protein A9Q86_06565 [Flavobacteriales bacterium 33_180_T64]